MNFKGTKGLTRGMRNNNVGNLKPGGFTYLGQIGTDEDGHAIFSDMKFGIRAFLNDIAHKFYTRKPLLDTFNKFVSVYAPKADKNNETEYTDWLVSQTGLGKNNTIPKDLKLFKKIANAVAKMEVSTKNFNMIPQEDWSFGYSYIIPIYFTNQSSGETVKTPTSGNILNLLLPVGIGLTIFFLIKKR